MLKNYSTHREIRFYQTLKYISLHWDLTLALPLFLLRYKVQTACSNATNINAATHPTTTYSFVSARPKNVRSLPESSVFGRVDSTEKSIVQ